MLVEQTQIAKQLGISMNALHRILHHGKIEDQYTMINNKRHYEPSLIHETIKLALKQDEALKQNG